MCVEGQKGSGLGSRRAVAGVLDGPGDDVPWSMPEAIVRNDPAGAQAAPIDCNMSNAGDDKKWKARFAWTSELQRLNQEIFGNNSFRPNQQQAINATLARKDVFLLMPTGGGEHIHSRLHGVIGQPLHKQAQPSTGFLKLGQKAFCPARQHLPGFLLQLPFTHSTASCYSVNGWSNGQDLNLTIGRPSRSNP